MDKVVFRRNTDPTIGVEIEVGLVDVKTAALSNSIYDILDRLPDEMAERIKPELMQSYLEINTGICKTVAEAQTDLSEKIRIVEDVADQVGLQLLWAGTHPFSKWQDQEVSRDDRYHRLLEVLQDVGRQLVTFGLHVHVGVDTGDKAVMICDRIMRHLPTLLALSCNSPFWNDRVTGLRSHRSKVMEALPTAGLPPLMRNWSEYVWLVNHMIETGFINTVRDLWWDVRPHHNFGTVEVRVCDVPGCLDSVLEITALVQCLVYALSEEIDHGTYQHDHHPMLIRQNKWRAGRYGLDATLVDSDTFMLQPAREVVKKLTDVLRPTSKKLDCEVYLDRVVKFVEGIGWADRQLEILEETKDRREVVRRMIGVSRLS